MKYYLRIFIFIILFSLTTNLVEAANLNFVSDSNNISVDQTFVVSLMIDTATEPINAVSVELKYPVDLLDLTDTREGASIINFWVDRPTINNQEGLVSLAGIIPGAYQGQGKLIDLVFTAKQAGSGQLIFQKTSALINDGRGTAAQVNQVNYDFNISIKSGQPIVKVGVKDQEPPESFIPTVARLDDIMLGKNFLVFATEDKNSGLSHYEIREGFGLYHKAESPYLLKHQDLDVDVYIKAVDKAGNNRVIKMSALHPHPWYEKSSFFAIILVAIIISFIIFRRWRKIKIK